MNEPENYDDNGPSEVIFDEQVFQLFQWQCYQEIIMNEPENYDDDGTSKVIFHEQVFQLFQWQCC